MNDRIDQPNNDPALGPIFDPGASLVESLGSTVDDLRQLYTDFGARPYRVFAVTYRWTGDEVGRGDPEVVSETELLPTPEIASTTSFRRMLLSGGTVERGGLTIRKISPRYTEDQLDVLCYGTHECRGPGFQTFLEASIDRRDGDRTQRRRMTIAAAPYRDALGLEWRIDVMRQDASRHPDGAPTVPSDHDPFAPFRR